MSVRKIDNSWVVDITFNHLRYRKKSPENTRTGAQSYETLLRQKLARGELIDKIAAQKIPTFSEFAEKWFESYVVPNNKHSEQRSKRYILDGILLPFFGELPIDEINTYRIEQFKARRIKQGTGNKPIKNYLTVLHTCLKAAYEWLELEGTPPKINWPKCAPTQRDFLSPDECELLLSHAEGAV